MPRAPARLPHPCRGLRSRLRPLPLRSAFFPRIAYNGTVLPPRSIILVLLVTVGCLDGVMAQNNSISVNPTGLSFCVAASNSPAPPAQILTVSSNTSTALAFYANAFPSWIRLDGVATPPSMQGNTASAPTITVTIDPSGYSSGSSQNGTVQIQSGNTSIIVQVALTVTSTCNNATTLSANPTSVNLSPTQTSQGVT